MKEVLIKEYNNIQQLNIPPKEGINAINFHFIDGAFVEITGPEDKKYNVKCINKITNEVIIVWSNILKNSPSSKLIIKNYQLDNIYTKDILFKKFEKYGINKEKLILESSSSREDILKKYNSIDIALDTFPWNGGTTSFELSWMCVPLLTLSGDRFMSRCGESINKNLNMNDWIVHNTDDYILQATKYCNNFHLLNKIRLNLRNSSRKSVLFDTNAFSISFLDSLNKVVDIYKKQNN
jgi:predicted O-linked N-acetylglucosamine transferase (SPINDLY family)